MKQSIIKVDPGHQYSTLRCFGKLFKFNNVNCQVSNPRIIETLAEFSTILQAVPDAELLTMFQLSLEMVFPHVFCTMCDTWRRLKLPCKRGWVQLLGICFCTVHEAARVLQDIAAQNLPCCHGDECTRIALAVTNNGTNLDMVEEVKNLFGQTLYHLPASSVNVEKLHSNTQTLCACHKAGRKPHVIQQNTYIMSCAQEHKKSKDELMTQVCGKTKVKMGRLLSRRVASRTMPSRPVTHFKAQAKAKARGNVATLARFWIDQLLVFRIYNIFYHF